jgi:hypothetical protein
MPVSRPFREALVGCAAAAMTGVLRVTGAPGGTIYLSGGGVSAIETPGAPGVEVMLLRSRRVSESNWDLTFAAAVAAQRPMGAELVARGLLGAGELEALLRIVIADAMFVMAAGLVDSCDTEAGPADCLLSLDPPANVSWLLAETSRRLAVVAGYEGLAGHEHDRVFAVPGAVRPGAVRPGAVLGSGRDEILALADGRRTPRDLAFALGCGVYATMLRLARMRADGLLAKAAVAAESDGEAAGQSRPADGTAQSVTVSGLPKRRKDIPGPSGHGMPVARWLLRPRSGADAGAEDGS